MEEKIPKKGQRPKFQLGHPRHKGRDVGSLSKKQRRAQDVLMELETELGKSINPLEGLLRISADERHPIELRIDCMAKTLPYLMPRLNSTALTNADHTGPVQVVGLNLAEILNHPELADAASALAIAIAEAEAAEHPQLLPSPGELYSRIEFP